MEVVVCGMAQSVQSIYPAGEAWSMEREADARRMEKKDGYGHG
jgi:hypothetical protein